MGLHTESTRFCLVLQPAEALQTSDMMITDLLVSSSQSEMKCLDIILNETSISAASIFMLFFFFSCPL